MILLLRHGQTEWNVERRFQGRADSPLTPLGIRQAHAMARLTDELTRREHGAWQMLASPLPRAWRTAEIIAEACGLAPAVDERLAEVDCGAWEGRTWPEVAVGERASQSSKHWIFDAPGGESFEAISTRIGGFLASLEPEPDRRLVIVSHGAAGRILRGLYAGLDREEILDLEVPQDAVYRLQNGQIDRFDCEPVE